MSLSSETMTPADIAAVTGNGGGFGGWGEGSWFIIILFLFAFLGWGGGYGRDGYSRDGRSDNSYRGNYSGRRRHYVRGHYSYAEGKEDLLDRISEMMEGGDLNDQEKQSLRRAMNELR